mmetsp:Transcript_8388/g.23635  ORF Transcript_8388/g.23635 Transcript_8388/m.23635 type:complete len:317 (+) Transcript_8388:543-1493(+)
MVGPGGLRVFTLGRAGDEQHAARPQLLRAPLQESQPVLARLHHGLHLEALGEVVDRRAADGHVDRVVRRHPVVEAAGDQHGCRAGAVAGKAALGGHHVAAVRLDLGHDGAEPRLQLAPRVGREVHEAERKVLGLGLHGLDRLHCVHAVGGPEVEDDRAVLQLRQHVRDQQVEVRALRGRVFAVSRRHRFDGLDVRERLGVVFVGPVGLPREAQRGRGGDQRGVEGPARGAAGGLRFDFGASAPVAEGEVPAEVGAPAQVAEVGVRVEAGVPAQVARVGVLVEVQRAGRRQAEGGAGRLEDPGAGAARHGCPGGLCI